MATKQRPVVAIAGFGDTGVLVAAHLPDDFDVIAISTKPCLISGQELGTRLTNYTQWKEHYQISFKRFKALDNVTVLHGKVTAVEAAKKTIEITLHNEQKMQQHYDALVIATGVSNGFWRDDDVTSSHCELQRQQRLFELRHRLP